MSIKQAVLIDGVGGIRKMKVADGLLDIRFPRPTRFNLAMKDAPSRPEPMPVSVFAYLGSLPNETLVYAFVYEFGVPFALWQVQASWVDGLPNEAIKEVNAEMERSLTAIDPQAPVVRLYDRVTHDSRNLNTRLVMGVARLPSQQIREMQRLFARLGRLPLTVGLPYRVGTQARQKNHKSTFFGRNRWLNR